MFGSSADLVFQLVVVSCSMHHSPWGTVVVGKTPYASTTRDPKPQCRVGVKDDELVSRVEIITASET